MKTQTKGRKPLPRHVIFELRRMRGEGLTIKEIASITGYAYLTVHKYTRV